MTIIISTTGDRSVAKPAPRHTKKLVWTFPPSVPHEPTPPTPA